MTAGAALGDQANPATRAKHTRELYGLIEQAAATKTTQEWLDI